MSFKQYPATLYVIMDDDGTVFATSKLSATRSFLEPDQACRSICIYEFKELATLRSGGMEVSYDKGVMGLRADELHEEITASKRDRY